MVNGVLTLPLSGISFGSSQAPRMRAHRPAEFVVGPENALAVAALRPLLEASSCGFSPIVLYGPHGSGKSHLACGLADWWRRRFPSVAVACLPGGDFARDYADALEADRLEVWRSQLYAAGLFVLDDLGELGDKRPAQVELLHALDMLADREAVVIVTARTLPGHWPALLPALRGRLSAGLSVPLALPAPVTRRAILEPLAAARGVALPSQTLDALAADLDGGVPALMSALLELELAGSGPGQPVDPQQLRRRALARGKQPTLRQVAGHTAKYFGLKVVDLRSPARRRTLVAGRGVAMYLARQLTTNSLGQIGKYFGGRDHTTVLYGCRRTERLLERDRALRRAVAELKALLASTV